MADEAKAGRVDVKLLKQGARFLKFGRRGRPKLRNFVLSGDTTVLRYAPSRKKVGAHVRLEDVDRVQAGQHTRNFARFASKYGDKADLCFSIVLASGLTRDLLCSSKEQRDLWVASLCHVVETLRSEAGRDPEAAYVRRQWQLADADGSGSLTFREISRLLATLNVSISNSALSKLFKDFDADGSGELELPEFESFLRKLRERPEVEQIVVEHGSDVSTSQLAMLPEELARFLGREQGLAISTEKAQELCEQLDPVQKGERITAYGLARLLSRDDNEVFDPAKLAAYADMTLPLSHYFIASSHNTYLEGDQLRSASSVNMYITALSKGCRCVELDCWDGSDGEPEIYHGHTLTTRIKFADVIRAVREYGFKTSPYPVILSLENHCSLGQQERMAAIMTEVLGDMLPTPLGGVGAPEFLPSPEALKYKVLIKGKSLEEPSSGADEDEEEEGEGGEDGAEGKAEATAGGKEAAAVEGAGADVEGVEEAKAAPDATPRKAGKKKKVAQALSDLVFLKAVKCRDFDMSIRSAKAWEMSSFSETKLRKRLKKDPLGFVDYNKRQLARIYPAGTRVDSSNYNPVPGWMAGCQIVALNYQTPDQPMQLNDGRFRENASTGYVPKPEFLRTPSRGSFHPEQGPFTRAEDSPMRVTIRVLSAQELPKPNQSAKGEVIDPYVVLTVAGMPNDSQRVRTRAIDNNGFNPVWDQEFVLSVRTPELALLHMAVWDADVGRDDFIAYYVVPLACIRPGYRTCPLFAGNGSRIPHAAVFCRISIE